MIEAIHMDTETTPATGSRVAERMITRNEAAFLIGAIHSGVANAISQVAQKYGCVYLNTNSSSPTEAGKDCHRVKFVWDGNGTNFAQAIVKNAMAVNGKHWVLLTNDYVWGHSTAKATRTIVEANGGKIVEELLVPQNTRDFSSYLLKIQQIKPDVVATAVGGDDIKALRQQVVQLKMNKSAGVDQQPAGLARRLRAGPRGHLRRVRHQLVLPARPAGRQGIRRGVPEDLSRACRSRCRATSTTTATWRRASCCARSSARAPPTTSRSSRSSRTSRSRARDRMQHFDAYMNPATHQMQQTIYMATYNDAPAEKDDIFKILAKLPPKEVEDPDAAGACKLESYERRRLRSVSGVA